MLRCGDSVTGEPRAKMRVFLPALLVLRAAHIHCIFEGTCPRKDPPPGVLTLSPGSNLVLTCKGLVMVDGVKVNISRDVSTAKRSERAAVAPTPLGNISNKHIPGGFVSDPYHVNPEADVSAGTGESPGGPQYTDKTPTTHVLQPTSAGRLLKIDMEWETEEVDGEGVYEEDDEEDEGGESSRVTRGIKSNPQWKRNGKNVGTGRGDGRDITLERRGTTLSLSSVRVTDSGRYSCHHRGRERFSLKVVVAEPPEIPKLSCYKKTPTSKIRCEWIPQRPVTRLMNTYLILNKRPAETFLHFQCSYSSRLARYWCALDHNDDELRILHMAFLCVTSITGNATSTLLPFTPLGILKPDPPSDVKVTQVEGHELWMKVTWNLPTSWKPQDIYYELSYELKYQPLGSSYHVQRQFIKSHRSYMITDAMPGVKYLIQLRAKEEYDGQWSDWSTPVNASSWTAQKPGDDLMTTMFPVSIEEGSAAEDYVHDTDAVPGSVAGGVEVSHHVLWISGSFVLVSLILAAYIFRHKDRLLSKLHRLSFIVQPDDLSQPPPSALAAPEGQALVPFTPACHREPPPTEEEEGEEEKEEEHRVTEGTEALHFNNTSYFLTQRQ